MYPPAFLLSLYRTMLRIRLCEESIVEPVLTGEIRCPVHLYSGEEAVATGICAALSPEDYGFGTHRSHGHYIAKGGDLKKLVAEVYCREPGCSRGRGGSMHVVDMERGIVGSAPIVAGTISLAAGAALASKIRGDGRVTVSFFGDGATGEGVLFESLNFAALRNLPLIFACENNLYSTHLPISECRPNARIADIGRAFGVRSFRVDGNDVLKVHDAALKAADICRKGEGPIFMELLTYRLRGHVGPDDNVQGNHTDIRPLEEVETWRKRDPIKRLKRRLLKSGGFKTGDLRRVDREVRSEIEAAHTFARHGNRPDQDEVTRYVFR